eukprot:366410-Chlamydomonas_euryale.AAC.24
MPMDVPGAENCAQPGLDCEHWARIACPVSQPVSRTGGNVYRSTRDYTNGGLNVVPAALT